MLRTNVETVRDWPRQGLEYIDKDCLGIKTQWFFGDCVVCFLRAQIRKKG